jgi:hypothetical protein
MRMVGTYKRARTPHAGSDRSPKPESRPEPPGSSHIEKAPTEYKKQSAEHTKKRSDWSAMFVQREAVRKSVSVQPNQRIKPTGRNLLPDEIPRVEIEILPDEVQRAGLDLHRW